MFRCFAYIMLATVFSGVSALGISPAEAQAPQPIKSSAANSMMLPQVDSLPPLMNAVKWMAQGSRSLDGG